MELKRSRASVGKMKTGAPLRFKRDGMKDSRAKRKEFDVGESGDRSQSSSVRRSIIRGDGVARKGKPSDLRLSQRKPRYAKRGSLVADDSNGGKKSERIAFKPRVRGREGPSVGSEALSKGKLKSNEKKMNGRMPKYGAKGDSEEKILDKGVIGEEEKDSSVEKKRVIYQTRLLDKSGKKIRGHKKDTDDVVADAQPKKRKRIIRIDPYDISNKRHYDGTSNKEKPEVKEVEPSKNAQFRAIQPSPSILTFVEDNLLGRRRLNELRYAGYNVKLPAPLDNIPFSTSTERERLEENVFRNKLEFFAAAKVSSSFPPPLIPEIAFAGRSNVGKSSLLNALTRQWGVVRTSDKPGLTQTINFFKLDPKLSLVDLPGYGFAYAKEEVKDAWEELVKEYVSTRVGLKRVCLLIDCKWGMKPRDHELVDLMERSQTPYQIVLTKTDAVLPIDVARRAMQVQENLKANKSIVSPVMMVSSKSGAGIRNLRTALAKIARFLKP
ncbi:hypothetical protein J5N97_017475 [Dioscorea zingiberensis]|uniref:EngB-type G domain-containing protein n=1 Tax=Dioscorea zingiberensis TaxID=325984 RepID=A0A9D5HGE7_9LILI|nr:hypothetical protein J5N97_017475 [Dioscorea zingiberensis]